MKTQTLDNFPIIFSSPGHTYTCTLSHSQCQPQPVHKLKLQFHPGSVPPYIGSEHVGCTTCDHTLREELGFMPIKNSGSGGSTANSSTTGTYIAVKPPELSTLLCIVV